MKNKHKLLLLGLFTFLLFGIQNVSASTLNYDFSGYYYERMNGDGTGYSSYKLENYYVDGEVAYCIEPGIPEGVTYSTGNWSNSGLSDSIKERVLEIAYYGYSYDGHQTQSYRAATQAMIWESIMGSGSWVRYTPERYGKGNLYDVSYERNVIENLVANHTKKPSFNGTTVTGQVGSTITLTDTNNVLSNFEVYASNGAKVSINGNILSITPNTNGNINLQFVKTQNYKKQYIVYYGSGQNMLTAGTVDPVVFSINVNSYYGKLDINKSDSETGINQGQATLKDAEYGVYNSSTGQLVTTIKTDENGNASTGSILSYDSYYLQEIKASKGYKLDSNRYYFDSKNKQSVSLNVTENVIKNYISILKQYDYVDGTTQFLNAEANITFEIYYLNGDKFSSITTDKNGYATLNLPYGVWKFHQVNTTTGFEKIYDFYITVDENSELEQYYNILNNSISAYLQVFKSDSETGEVIKLANTTFKILNTDTNKYVSQYVGGKIYSEFKTDENGKFITYLKLESGNYKLIEVNSPSGYLINKSGIEFTIGNDTYFNYTTYGAFITIYFKNTAIKGQIEINKTGETFEIKNGSFFYNSKELSGVKFEIYASEDIKSADGNYIYFNKGDLVDTLITNDKGYAISTKLPLGKYYLIEISTQDGYVLDVEKHYIELNEIDDVTPIVYNSFCKLNELKKGTIEFTKTDLVSGDVIPNTTIQIYDENDNLIFTGTTDENGKVIITDLKVGKYYILETNPADGYILNEEKVYFEILENGQIVKASMTNEKIVVEVPNTLNNDYLEIEMIVLILIGSGVIVYGLSKTKNKKKK